MTDQTMILSTIQNGECILLHVLRMKKKLTLYHCCSFSFVTQLPVKWNGTLVFSDYAFTAKHPNMEYVEKVTLITIIHDNKLITIGCTYPEQLLYLFSAELDRIINSLEIIKY